MRKKKLKYKIKRILAKLPIVIGIKRLHKKLRIKYELWQARRAGVYDKIEHERDDIDLWDDSFYG